MAINEADNAGSVRVALRIPQAQAQMLDEINAYLGLGDRADTVRYLMLRGAEQIRFQQTVREQADVIQKFTSVLSDDFAKLAEAMGQAEAEKDQKVLDFEVPEEPRQKLKVRIQKGSGPSSTGTKSQK